MDAELKTHHSSVYDLGAPTSYQSKKVVFAICGVCFYMCLKYL